MSRTCETCRKKLRKRPRETNAVFERRRFCSRPCIYAPRRKLTAAQVKKARTMILKGVQGRAIARRMKVPESVIYGLTLNRTYQHLPWPEL